MSQPSCVPNTSSPVDPAALESPAYRAGHGDGSTDKRQGRRYNPYSRDDRFPPATRSDYVQGYNAGYRNAHDNPWSQRRARELGYSHGRQDKLAGRSMKPDRHSSEVPGSVRPDFRRGYQDGWNTVGIGRPIPPPRPVPY